MQEDIEHRAVTLVINGVKLTGRTLKNAISKYLAHRKQKARESPVGKQTVKELVGQGQGVTNIEITDGNIKSFERVARKYGVDYAVKKDCTGELPRYLVFFEAKDSDALTSAFKEYTAKAAKREEKRRSPPAPSRNHGAKERAKPGPHKKKHRELVR